jgi:hypothetical protein
VIDIRSVAALAAAAVLAVTAHAEPNAAQKEEPAPVAQRAPSGGFKQDVKRAWSDTRAGIHRAGRELRDGVRSAGRATGDAFRSGWRKVKETFAGEPAPAKPGAG